MEAADDFILLGSKIAPKKSKKSMFLGRKSIIDLNSVPKSRDITLPRKIRTVWAVSPIV